MALVQTVPPPPGVKDALSLLAFVQDSKQAGDYLKRMEAVRDEINELVTAHGKVTEIEGLRIQARDDRQAAAEDLANATREATQIRADAEQAMIAANDAAKLERKSAQDFRAKFERDAKDRTAQLDARTATLDAREQALVNRELAATALMEKARELEAKYTTAIGKLQSAGVTV